MRWSSSKSLPGACVHVVWLEIGLQLGRRRRGCKTEGEKGLETYDADGRTGGPTSGAAAAYV